MVFVLLAAAVIGVSQFLRQRPPVELQLAANPLIEGWAQAVARDFNATETIVNANRRVTVSVTVVDDQDVWNDNEIGWVTGPLDGNTRPSLWLPASTISIDYTASDSRVPFAEVVPSVAQTPLLWGGFESRVNAVTADGAQPFDWPTIAEAAALESWEAIGGDASWGFIKLGFNAPTSSMGGLGVLLSGAADFHDATALSSTETGDPAFREWMLPVLNSVPNLNTLGGDPAEAMAQRGASVADFALLPESQWLTNLDGLVGREPIVLSYPDYAFVLDFPLLRWDDPAVVDDDEAAGVEAFGRYVMNEARQASLTEFGLRPATDPAAPASAVGPLFAADAAPAGVTVQAGAGTPITAPGRSGVLALLTWYDQNR